MSASQSRWSWWGFETSLSWHWYCISVLISNPRPIQSTEETFLMPSTYNGIGTWYYGKQHVHRLKGSCPHCHRIGELESYDTTLYFVFFMIPIIPLKKKRILESCPYCQMHRVIDLSQWEEGKQKAIAEIIEKLRQDPDNREVILEAIGMSSFFQDQPLFDKLTTLAVDKTGDAEIQAALAAGYSYFSQRDKAIEAYKHSLVAEDNPRVRRDLAINFLRMGDPDQAEPLLRHVWETPDQEGIGHVQLLIEAYRSQGRHQEALRIMDLRDAAFPEFAQHADVQEQRRTSQKYLTSGKPIRSAASLADTTKSGYQEGSRMGGRVAKFIFPIILLALFALYIGVAIYKGNHRKVYFVNGTKQPYTVVVNGAEHKLLADQATPIEVAEGELDIKVNGLAIEPFRCTVETGFWGRPFNGTVFVVNPDRMAWVFEEEATYAENNPPMNPMPKLHYGEQLYQLPSVDYKFEDFPMQLQLRKGSRVTKTRIDLERNLTAIDRITMLRQFEPQAPSRANHLKRLVEIAPHEPLYLTQLVNDLSPDEAFAYLTPGLAKRPLQVDWHLMYQTLSERERPDHDLLPEYEAILKEVGSGDAKYLLSRLLDDYDRALRLAEEGAKAEPPSIYARYFVGVQLLSRGQFNEAVESLKAVHEALPGQIDFLNKYRESLWAAKKFDQLVLLPNPNPNVPAPVATQFHQLQIAAVQGDKARFDELNLQLFPQANVGEGFQRLGIPVKPSPLDILFPISQGDVKGYLRIKAGQQGEKSVSDLLLEGKIQEAANDLSKPQVQAQHPDNQWFGEQTLVYLYAKRDDLKDIAEQQWGVTLKAMSNSGRHARQLAVILEGKKPFEVKQVLASPVEAKKKRLILLLFADRFPEAKSQLTELARRLDFEPDIISLCLRQLIDKK